MLIFERVRLNLCRKFLFYKNLLGFSKFLEKKKILMGPYCEVLQRKQKGFKLKIVLRVNILNTGKMHVKYGNIMVLNGHVATAT